jgi:hypothetical protein
MRNIVDCQQPDVYMGTAALKTNLYCIVVCWTLALQLVLWCSCALQLGDFGIRFVAVCCNLPRPVRSCLRQHLEQDSVHSLIRSVAMAAGCIGNRWVLARRKTPQHSLRLPRLRAHRHLIRLPALTACQRCCPHALGRSMLHRSLKGAGGALPTIHRRISSGQMLLYRTWRL